MVLLFINGVIGAGIFGLPSKAFKISGVYSIAALLVCAVAVFVIILCFAEVSSRFDKTGGPYLYAHSSFGPLPAFLTGWLLFLTRFITFAALVNLLITYLAVFSPWFLQPSSRIISIIFITMLLAFINHIGVKSSTRVNNVLTIAKLLPLFLFIIVGLFYIQPANFEVTEVPGFSSFSSAVLLLVFAFGGFESVLVNSGEVKDPAKSLPFALLLSITAIAVLYILIQTISIGTLPTIGSSDKPLAEAAGSFIGKPGATLIAIGALVSITGTLNAIMLVGSRVPYALSEKKQFPKIFSYIHPRFNTPTWSLLLFMTITILVSITNSFIYAATISAIIRIIIYGIVCIALIKLRRKNVNQTGYFRVRYGKAVAIVGLLITCWLLSSSKINEIRDVAIASALGLIVYFVFEQYKKSRNEH
jgi:amino acid transporter